MYCGGWPFLDDGFDTRRLLTATAGARVARRDGTRSSPTPQDLASVLTPAEAVRIRALDLPKPLPGGALTADQAQQVHQTVRLIGQLVPAWAPLLFVPLVYLPMPAGRGSISASCFAWPQHILLATDAFDGRAVLAEQVLHETFHQWLYLCEELAALQHPGCVHQITLPSGTGGRSPAELLGAAHVTCGLARLWPLLDVPATVCDRRLAHLSAYRSGCLALLETVRPCLTEHGHSLADRILEVPE